MDRAEVCWEGVWNWLLDLFQGRVLRRTRGVEREEARKDGDLMVLGAERGISMGGVHGPRVAELGPRAG